jgi:hypothetical protein
LSSKRKISILIIFFAVVLINSSVGGETTNIIRDGGFETWRIDGRPLYWGIWNWYGTGTISNSTNRVSGNYSVGLSNGISIEQTNYIPISEYKTKYAFSGYFINPIVNTATLQVAYYYPNNSGIGSFGYRFQSSDWKLFNAELVVPPGINRVWIRFNCPPGVSLFVDEVRLEKVSIPASVNIHPKILNLKSSKRWIITEIELTEGYNVEDIIVTSILLNNIIPADNDSKIGDRDNDGFLDIKVKFDSRSVQNLLTPGENILTLTGLLTDGTAFEGTATIIVK